MRDAPLKRVSCCRQERLFGFATRPDFLWKRRAWSRHEDIAGFVMKGPHDRLLRGFSDMPDFTCEDERLAGLRIVVENVLQLRRRADGV